MKNFKNLINLKSILYLLILFVFLFTLTGCNDNKEKVDNNTNITSSAERTSRNINEENAENRIANIVSNANEIMTTNKEEELSSYSTVIKDKASGRLTNISITCSTLNGKVIHSGETFSFNSIVGKPTAEKGYQEATVIIDHKSEKGVGGGNCQVSSTLYNAVLAIPSLTIIERHEHGKDVTYVPEGKDAAVSYGSLDLKFRNDTGHDIRIDVSTDNASIVAKIIKI